jgi:hypothetical protein
LWAKKFQLVAKNYTEKPHTRTPRKDCRSVNTLQKHALLQSVGGEAEGLRRKELLYNTATLVPIGWADSLERQ